MGWWTSNQEGNSFAPVRDRHPNTVILWGDGPADLMGAAIQQIDAEFENEWGRKPTVDELVAGVKFSARVDHD